MDSAGKLRLHYRRMKNPTVTLWEATAPGRGKLRVQYQFGAAVRLTLAGKTVRERSDNEAATALIKYARDEFAATREKYADFI